MRNILFCNSTQEACGVHQYGINLFAAMELSNEFDWCYACPKHEGEMAEISRDIGADVVVYNWHPGQGAWMAGAPFPGLGAKQALVFHDWRGNTDKFDAVLFSDPTMKDHDNWYSIPRPLPAYEVQRPEAKVRGEDEVPLIGVHGFGGASAERVMERVMAEFDRAYLRAHLPFAFHGDAAGAAALNMARHLLKMALQKPGIVVEISHRWLDQDELLAWLAQNDLNCYLRDTGVRWEGVSSALDTTLAVRRPLAVNKCQGFRHVHGCVPSICVEDRSLKDILATGTAPLEKLYEENTTERLRASVDEIMDGLTNNRPGLA